MANYVCPLCNASFKRYKWFVKHIQRYSEEDRKKIFVHGDKLLFQGKLKNFMDDNPEEKED